MLRQFLTLTIIVECLLDDMTFTMSLFKHKYNYWLIKLSIN